MLSLLNGHPQVGSGPVSSYLDGVLPSTVFDLDATITASYPGSGVTWANLATPADGSAKTAYDFYRGDGATSTTYPTFNGTAGSAAAYWSFDGGDNFRLKSGTNTDFFNNLHKTTGGTNFWVAVAFNINDGSLTNSEFLFSSLSTPSSAYNGLALRTLSSENLSLFQSGETLSSVSSTTGATFTAIGPHIAIFSRSTSSTITRIWVNGLARENIDTTWDASSTNPTGSFVIGSNNTSTSYFLTANINMFSFAMGNEYLDDTKAAAIRSHLAARHVRSYG